MASVRQLLERRISAKNFIPSAAIDRSVINLLLDSARLAPSAYNLQHTRFIVLADTKADLQIADIAAACVAAGSFDESYAQRQCQQIAASYHGDHLQQLHRDEAIRSASLASMYIMLQATEIGLGSCPISGFDEAKLRQQFAIAEALLPIMIISLGRAELSAAKPRRPLAEYMLTAESY